MKEPAELWFLAAVAWSRAALATEETRRENNLLELAFRAMQRARAADPERSAREAKAVREPNSGPLFADLKP